jgi:hypothetical protein
MKLEDAVRALRDEGGVPADDAEETRARVVAKLERGGRRRTRRPFVILSVAAALAAATASGAVRGLWFHRTRLLAMPTRASIALAPRETNVSPLGPVASAISLVEPPVVPATPHEPLPGLDALALYRVAHRLHFASRDPLAALSAWNDYLRVDPHGAFALEARYNRAVCLVRLGRVAEAREALAPLAADGGYRTTDARALLDALDTGPTGDKTQIE